MLQSRRDRGAGLPEGKTTSSRNVLASVSDQARAIQQNKIPVIEMLSIARDNGDRAGTEREREIREGGGKQSRRSPSLHAVMNV